MDSVEQNLVNWRASLMTSIPLGGLMSRNSVVYKWKAPHRCWMLREAVFWRITDLLTQSHTLHQRGHGLGARILLRSAFETLAILIYVNQLIQLTLDGELDFHLFSQKTSTLLLGSRDRSTEHQSINIMTILEKCDRRYPGLAKLYGTLSESAHPNFEGMVAGYSKVDHDEFETRFSNRWMEMHGDKHLGSMELCMATFHYEYNTVWADLTDKLEIWIETNDTQLEATKNDPLPNG